MIARLILALFVLAAGVPAMAVQSACHDAPAGHAMPGMAAMAAQAAPRPARGHDLPQGAQHLCMGCIAPATLKAPRLAAMIVPVARRVPAPRHDGATLPPASPATPPPRSIG